VDVADGGGDVGPAGADVGVVEGAGGVRSPLAGDGDIVDLAAAVEPDLVVLVAGPGLGTLNLVRLSADALAPWPLVVYLNRFDGADDLHRRNRDWIERRMGLAVDTSIGQLGRRLGGC
jgi:dethiobiotin synthetase